MYKDGVKSQAHGRGSASLKCISIVSKNGCSTLWNMWAFVVQTWNSITIVSKRKSFLSSSNPLLKKCYTPKLIYKLGTVCSCFLASCADLKSLDTFKNIKCIMYKLVAHKIIMFDIFRDVRTGKKRNSEICGKFIFLFFQLEEEKAKSSRK